MNVSTLDAAGLLSLFLLIGVLAGLNVEVWRRVINRYRRGGSW